MSNVSEQVPESATWPPLPETIPEVVTFFEGQILNWVNNAVQPKGQTTDAAASLEFMVNNPSSELLPSAEYLAQRAALEALGLDPDILAPITPANIMVGVYLNWLTYSEQSAQAWILGVGWSQADCDTICAQLVFIDPAAVAYVATLTPGVQTINGNLVNIIL